MKTFFTEESAWNGGYYELSIELGPPSDERLMQALRAIWQMRCLVGCYLDRHREPEEQDRVEPVLASPGGHVHFYGVATLADQQTILCGTVSVRDVEGADWLSIYIPIGALGHVYKQVGGYPFGDAGSNSRLWREALEKWLAQIGLEVFSTVQFPLGVIGYEVSGIISAVEVAKSGVPEVRRAGYLWPRGEVLEHFPTNEW